MDELEQLKKIDLIRERMSCGYEAAKLALDSSNGSIIEALTLLEREQRARDQDFLSVAEGIVNEIQEIAREGGRRRLRIRFGDRLIKDIPIVATAGVAVLLTVAAVLITQTTIELEPDAPAALPEPAPPVTTE